MGQVSPIPALAAAVTTCLRLGTIVLSNPFRHPVLLAKEAAFNQKIETIKQAAGSRFDQIELNVIAWG